MPKTTGWKDLDLAEEVSAIEQSLAMSSTFKAKVLNTPSKGKVLEELKVSRVVHFACQGVSVAEDPSSSCPLLRNGPDDNPQQVAVRELAKISFPTSTTGLSIGIPLSRRRCSQCQICRQLLFLGRCRLK